MKGNFLDRYFQEDHLVCQIFSQAGSEQHLFSNQAGSLIGLSLVLTEYKYNFREIPKIVSFNLRKHAIDPQLVWSTGRSEQRFGNVFEFQINCSFLEWVQLWSIFILHMIKNDFLGTYSLFWVEGVVKYNGAAGLQCWEWFWKNQS